jgi:single-strand DNA-binding protein
MFDGPEDSELASDSDPAAGYIQDSNGDLVGLDLETGELTESGV